MFGLCVLFVTFSIITANILNPEGPTHKRTAVQCLETIARDHFHFRFRKTDQQYVLLLTMLVSDNMSTPAYEIQEGIVQKINHLIQFPVEVIKDKRHEFKSYCSDCNSKNKNKKYKRIAVVDFKTYFYIIVIDTFKTLDEKLKVLRKVKSFNPKAEYLIYYAKITNFHKDAALEVFKKFWSETIFNVLILIPESPSFYKLYKMNINEKFPRKCGWPVYYQLIDECQKGIMINNSQHYFEYDKFKKFGNCSLDVVAMPYKPFVIDNKEGFEITVLLEIGKYMNISFNITLNDEAESWGEIKNESWTNSLGLIYNQTYSLGIGNIGMDDMYYKDFDFTQSHVSEYLIWVVPTARFMPKWRTLIVIFSLELWGVCLGSIIFFALIFYMLSKYKHEVKVYKKLQECFLNSFKILISTPVIMPVSDLVRVFFLSLAIFNIIISSIYTSSLIYYLTNPIREYQIASVSDIVDSNLDIGGLEYYKELFNKSHDKFSEEIFNRFQIENDTAKHWLKSVAIDRDTATLFSKLYVEYSLTEKDDNILIDSEGFPLVYIVNQNVLHYYLNIVMKKGFPLLETMNDIISNMISAGLINKFSFKYLEAIKRFKVLSKQHANVSQLSLDHLQGAFVILIFGYVFGLLFFLMEIVWMKCCNSGRKKAKDKIV